MSEHKLLMIPGPIEFEPEVMQRMSSPSLSHVDPSFIVSFGNALSYMKKVWKCPDGQPFIIAGTGTLAMEMAVANLVECGDHVLVISTGYFGERYANILKRLGAEVDVLNAKIGAVVSEEVIAAQLEKKNYKLMTLTHVDTSTGVKSDAKQFGALGKKYNVLTVLDGVCSVAGEEIQQQKWDIDVVLTASQKAVGVPAGLALLMVSPQAIEVFKNRSSPVVSYYSDWSNWLPIMEAYSHGKPSYFGTPAVHLVLALEKSLELIVKEGLEIRFNRHETLAQAFRKALQVLGFGFIAKDECAANTLSAIVFPENLDGAKFIQSVAASGVIVAGGLLADRKSTYFRVGHMGSVKAIDLVTTLEAIENGLLSCDHSFEKGVGTKRFLELI